MTAPAIARSTPTRQQKRRKIPMIDNASAIPARELLCCAATAPYG